MPGPDRQLDVLKSVHKFQLELLARVLTHPIPVPGPIEQLLSNSAEPGAAPDIVQLLRHWLDLLDLAITPLMVRDALKDRGSPPVAEALLCHYVWKRSTADPDRDKTDFIATYLYRHPQVPGQFTESRARTDDGQVPPPPFELSLLSIIGEDNIPPLPEEHRQLAREFDFFRQEVEDFRRFEHMMDSGLMNRVRDVKESLGPSFYHPHVLAIIASYNHYFGQAFDNLFHDATRAIKSFAETVQQQGGSIMSRVDGDVILKQLADIQESKILQTEYQRAQEHFRRVSRFKKAVDSRRGRDPAVSQFGRARQFSPSTPPASASSAAAPQASAHSSDGVEESKIQAMEESITHFIRAAGKQTSVSVVPLRHGNLALLPPEADAFRVDYMHEKSFRADYARHLIRVVALIGSMAAELNDYRSKQSSSYLWKPHADSLAYLMKASQLTLQQCQDLVKIAQQRGLVEKVNGLNGSSLRLQEQIQVVARALQALGNAS